MPRLPMRLHSGVVRHLTSPTVAGAAPELQLAKAIRAPDSRLNHRPTGSHLRGAHGSRIGGPRRRDLRRPASCAFQLDVGAHLGAMGVPGKAIAPSALLRPAGLALSPW
ncbi:hypothetical protein XAPC_160 [Xanthomonas citri pv. punicae str. LMG 859]|nr:hypothetical protein XAPC_160 [Xanthomonas citri pv. punicae str. LMG 859]